MKILFLILIFFSASYFIFSQESKDTIKADLKISDSFLNLQNKIDELEFYFDLNALRREIVLNENRETIWLWTYQSLKYSSSENDFNLPSHISLPLYRQYIENSKFRPVQYILGMVQTGAAGYLIYKSVKKHGLFPKN